MRSGPLAIGRATAQQQPADQRRCACQRIAGAATWANGLGGYRIDSAAEPCGSPREKTADTGAKQGD